MRYSAALTIRKRRHRRSIPTTYVWVEVVRVCKCTPHILNSTYIPCRDISVECVSIVKRCYQRGTLYMSVQRFTHFIRWGTVQHLLLERDVTLEVFQRLMSALKLFVFANAYSIFSTLRTSHAEISALNASALLNAVIKEEHYICQYRDWNTFY